MAYNYNPYMNNNYYSQYAGGYQYQPQYTQVQNQTQDSPFVAVRFGTLDEAKAHIVPPAKAVMFIKSDFSELYIKSADQMGNPSLETIKCTRMNNLSNQVISQEIDTSEFVKKADLEGFITKDDLKSIDRDINVLKQQIKLNSLTFGEKGEKKDGKQG